jgi:hypothetical protein
MNSVSIVRDRRVRVAAVLSAACLALIAGASAVAACITAPPPDLPVPSPVRPTVLNSDPPGGTLLQWPQGDTFVVFVEMDNPTETFVWHVFVDYYASYPVTSVNPGFQQSGSGPDAPDSGVTRVTFDAQAPLTVTCPHRIDFVVAHQFATNSDRVPDKVGGDSVTWWYWPKGSPCADYDAGDGVFPEASFDGLPIPPEAGGTLPEAGDP